MTEEERTAYLKGGEVAFLQMADELKEDIIRISKKYERKAKKLLADPNMQTTREKWYFANSYGSTIEYFAKELKFCSLVFSKAIKEGGYGIHILQKCIRFCHAMLMTLSHDRQNRPI